jgi:mRNA interferase RelE/StbE
LTKEPAKKGKALVVELTGFRSLRAARYRVLYKVEKERVIIVAVGMWREGDTKDIYARAKKLLRLKLIEIPIDRQEDA